MTLMQKQALLFMIIFTVNLGKLTHYVEDVV